MNSLASESLTLRVQAEQIAAAYLASSRIGRPSNLAEPDTLQLFLAALQDGNYRETACKLSGFSKSSLYRLLEQADHGNKDAQAFRDALEKAESGPEARAVRNVLKAGELPQFWAASMTYLERRWPDRWGRRPEDTSTPRVVVQIGTGQTDVTVNVLGVNRPDLANSLMHNDMRVMGQVNESALIRHVNELTPEAIEGEGARPAEGPTGVAVAPRPVGVSERKSLCVRGTSAKDVSKRRRVAGKKKARRGPSQESA